MAFFNRESTPPAAAPPPKPAPAAPPARDARGERGESTHIADGSKVVGMITGAAEIVVDGELEGEVVLDSKVIVGPRGRVRGRIDARSVQVGGKVFGNVHGSERVEVLASGSLEGDVTAPRVVIAEGAFFKGKVEMSDKATKAAASVGVHPSPPAAPAPQAQGPQPQAPQPQAPQPQAPPAQAAQVSPPGGPKEGRSDAPREGGQRESGQREGGHREGGHREGGHQGGHRDGGHQGGKPNAGGGKAHK